MSMTKRFILYTSPLMAIFIAISIFEPVIYQKVFASKKLVRMKNQNFEVIAHKGASGLAPENTLASFQKALDLGVDMIELDLRHTKDNELVVIHDATLDRTTNGNGEVVNFTLEEIKQLDAGSWFDPKFRDEKVPTLKEVLDLVNGKCKVLIEIKHDDHPNYKNVSEKLIEVLKSEENGFDWVILQAYEQDYLTQAKALDSRVQTKKILIGEDSSPLLAFYTESRVHLGRSEKEKSEQVQSLNPHFETLSPRRVFRMHARGFKVYTYPVNERDDMIIALRMGVDGIITDYPDRLIQIRKELDALKD